MCNLKRGGGFRPITLEKMISTLELEGKTRTRPNILRGSFGSIAYVQYCPCEASGQKQGQKTKIWIKGNRAYFLWMLGSNFFGGLNQKSAADSMCKIHIYLDSETFRQIY